MNSIERKPFSEILAHNLELSVVGDWLCLNIDVRIAWPSVAQAFTFEGKQVWLIPHTTDSYPGLALNRSDDMDRDDGFALLHRALSIISWIQDTGISVHQMSGGSSPRMMGNSKGGGVGIRDTFDLSDLPEIPNDQGKLALALMREGRSLNHPAYAFLSFFKALETAIPDGKLRAQWVTEQVDNIQGHRAMEALSKLRETVSTDIGEHLRESGRHAIAHARFDPIINPDDPRDAKRLQTELPIIEALAVLAIEQRLGIQTRHRAWEEHLYELRGWKPVFGQEVIDAVMAGVPPTETRQIDAPVLNVRLRQSPPFLPFEGMAPVQAGYVPGKIEVVYRSADGLIDLIFWLNFAEERLEFDPEKSVFARDDGTAAAARNGKEIDRFFRDYFGNGELQMWDAEGGTLVSRCDAFIPLNCFLDIHAANAAIERWDAMIAERQASESHA